MIWGSLFALGAAVEVWALRNGKRGDTLSERVRRWFRVDTTWGIFAFTLVWASFSLWFLRHITGW